jgi:pectin methylesterase-like acyl-CoA thioesterase
MKRISSLLLATALLLGLGLIADSPVTAQPLGEIWVDDDFNSGTPGWNVTRFAVIQDGIDAVTNGGTVHVAAGTYDEQVVIDKTLTLQGAGATTVVKPSADNLTQAFTGLFWSGGTKNIAAIIVADVPGSRSGLPGWNLLPRDRRTD